MGQNRTFIPLNISVLSVSDTRSVEDDKSGDCLEKRIRRAGHKISGRLLIPDDLDRIVAALRGWIDNENVDVILSTGGTGLTGRDVTVEAHRRLYEKENNCKRTSFK